MREATIQPPGKSKSLLQKIWRARLLYLILLPGLLHLIIFKLLPVLGMVIAFQDFNIFQGIGKSRWVGLEHFRTFLQDSYFWKLVRNTVLLALYNLLFVFPIPIVFALFVNEIRLNGIRRFVQTLSFFPYFISSAVLVTMMYKMLSPQGGLVNNGLNALGFESIFFMAEPGWFRPIYVMLNVWQLFGYYAIIYIAAMTAIDPALYEAAEIDGANRFQKIFRITLPSIRNTIVVMFILAIGQLFTLDLDKILMLYNPSVYETADVIQSYVYRQAFATTGFPNYSYGAAVGLVQSVIVFLLVITTNELAKRYSDSRIF